MKFFRYTIFISALAILPCSAQPSDKHFQASSSQPETASPAEVDARVSRFLKDQKLTRAQLLAVLAAAGVSEEEFRIHMSVQTALDKVLAKSKH